MPSHAIEGRRVYLDNAATTWPKSTAAVAAAAEFITECGATAGRGAYASALGAQRWVEQARTNIARLIGAESGATIAFGSSGTHVLNAALRGVLRAGDHVVTTAMEHNSLLRPLRALEELEGIELSIAEVDAHGFADPASAAGLLRPTTRLIAVGHASNVTGRVQDLVGWRKLAETVGARFLVDASQTLGYLPIDVRGTRIDLLAAAGHKGLRALHATGLLYVQGDLQSQLRPLMYGGTGSASQRLDGGQAWPQSVEVGNLNLPGIVSMAVAASECIAEVTARRWQAPYQRLVAGLAALPGVRLVGWEHATDTAERVPVVSIEVAGWDVHDLAAVLDTSFGIEVRAGWHCAALVHPALGTAAAGGTLRLSPGVSTTAEEVDYALHALRQILES